MPLPPGLASYEFKRTLTASHDVSSLWHLKVQREADGLPILDPEGTRPDYWRFARALHAVSARGSIIAAAETLNVTTSAVSQQLALMFRAGLLARRKEGSQVYYSVEQKTRDFLCGAVHALVVRKVASVV